MAQVVSIVIKGAREKVEEETEIVQEEQQEKVQCTDNDCLTHDPKGDAGVGLALTAMIQGQQLQHQMDGVKTHLKVIECRREKRNFNQESARILIWTGFLYLAAGVYFL